MNFWAIFPTICGYERVGDQVRLYVEGPNPEPRFDREMGTQTPLFHLYDGKDAEAILAWLARNRVWQCLRVPPPLTPELAVRAVLIAGDWHGGEGTALFRLARNRMIADSDHRLRLLRELHLLVQMVIENPVREGELEDLHAVEDVAHVAQVGVELCGTAEVVAAFFGV